jgi:hypothetical protein
MPYAEHLIARGAMVDPSPLTRPFRSADLVRALRAVDSLQVSAAVWRTARRIVRDLERPEHGPFGRVDGSIAAAAATHTLRDPLETRCRPTDAGCTNRHPADGRGFVSGGLAFSLLFGPAVAVTHPYFDTRLKYDPDYRGKKDRFVAGRHAEAYLAGQWTFGTAFFGSLPRLWGAGLIVSPAPYSYDHFSFSVGTLGVRLEGLLTQLDNLPDTGGVLNQRYFVAHRIVIRPPGRTTIAFSEGSLIAGRNRELEPWFANILNLGLLAAYDGGGPANNMLGVDVETRIGAVKVSGAVLIDDLQVDRGDDSDVEPSQYAFSLTAAGPIGGASWTARYAQVSNLIYRTHQPQESYMNRGVGLARNFSDYDQFTLQGGLLVAPALLVRPEITLIRQGQGDFRRPYPLRTAFATTPTFLSGTVERTLRLALAADWNPGSLQLKGDAGWHMLTNANHIGGADDARFVGSVSLTFRFRRESVLP